MSTPSTPFTLRALARGGSTLQEVRAAAVRAASDPKVVLIAAEPAAVRFPPVCPNCDLGASDTLPIRRAFEFHVPSYDDRPNETLHSIDEYAVPFCAPCLFRHAAEQEHPGPWTPLLRILSAAEGFAGIAVLAMSGWFASSALAGGSLVPLSVAGFAALVGLWLISVPWRRSRSMAVPKPSPVDSAVDFSPALAVAFEPQWRVFQFRSLRYADLFRAANADRLWDPNGAVAETAAQRRRGRSARTNLVVGAIVAAILLWSLWKQFAAR